MKNLIIIGARGFGREVHNIAIESLGYGSEFVVKGFLDSSRGALDGYPNYPRIIDSVEDYTIQEDDVFICALGDVSYKEKYVRLIVEKGGEFISLVHQTAIVNRNTTFGKGCIFCQNVNVSCDITIGNYVTFQPFVMVGHDCKIGDFCHLNTYAFCGGFVEVEDCVTLHTGSIVHPKKRVGSGAVVGAGAVVIRNVAKGITVFGNPAIRLS